MKNKKKLKKKGTKKAEIPALVDQELDDDSNSEEPSPVKKNERVARAEVVLPKKTLAERINEMDPEQKEEFKKEMHAAFIDKSVRGGDNLIIPVKRTHV